MMGAKEAQQKLSFNLTCSYYATPGEAQECRDWLKKYLELEKHQQRLSEWELLAAGIHTKGPNMTDDVVRIVMFGVKFTHKWVTLGDLGLARRTFWDASRLVGKIMSKLDRASVEDRGILERSKMFSYTCSPRRETGDRKRWGIDGVCHECRPRVQAGPNAKAQQGVQVICSWYMEAEGTLRVTEAPSWSPSRPALREACRRLDGAKGNTGPLWNALYCTSVLDCKPLQLDIDLAVFTMKQFAHWYGELLQLFKTAIQSRDMLRRVDEAADLLESLSPALNGKKADVDDASATSDSERTLLGEQDCDLEKATVVEVKKAYKPGRGGVDDQQRRKRDWWRTLLPSMGTKVRCWTREPQPADIAAKLREQSLEIECAHAELSESVFQFAAQVEQLRILAKEYILLTRIQAEWARVEALVKMPGVDISEVNKVTTFNVAELSSHSWRSKALCRCAKDVKTANKAMMQDAINIARRGIQLKEDLDNLFKDHRLYRAQSL
ncbi:hypothetical protein LZ30DRAFT_235293 [Colletotrichum cereale]|nr:hypothetical protein LZ30DRAFT_235293 [Colletotrichum cereale]